MSSQVYKKKEDKVDKVEGEEVKKQQPEDSDKAPNTRGGRGGRGGNRGGRGGRGGAPRNEDQKDGEQKTRKNDRRDDPNYKETYYYKFHYERPEKWEKLEVTLDTVLAEQVKREDRLKDPDQTKFEEQMNELNAQVEELKKKIREISSKKMEKIEGKKTGTSNTTVGEDFRENIEKIKKLKNRRKGCYDEVNMYKDRFSELINQITDLRKGIHKKYKTVKDVKRGIKELSRRIETETLDKNTDFELKKELKMVENSLPLIEKLSVLEPELDKIKVERNKRQPEIKELKAEIDLIEASIKGQKDSLDLMKGNREEKKQDLDKLDAQKQELSTAIGAIFTKKDDLREEFFKQKYLVKKQQEEIKKLDVLLKRKQRLLDDQKRNEEYAEKRKEEQQNRAHPYIHEMDLCEHLIGYCRRVGGLLEEETKVQKDEFFDEMRAKEIADNLKKQVKDGKIVKDLGKNDADFYSMMGNATASGAKNKKKRNRNKGQTEEVNADEININIETISFFAHLQVKAPIKVQDCPAAISELEKKLTHFEEKGDKELEEGVEEVEDTRQKKRNDGEDRKEGKKGKTQKMKYNDDGQDWPDMN